MKEVFFKKLYPVVWPPLEEELRDYLKYFKGNVLNAGAGKRDISPFIQGRLFNQELSDGQHNSVDILAPLENIPMEDSFFDAILCNAVLEHVKDPNLVMTEFNRVLKMGGYLYLTIPFMQPEHRDPADFQRCTKDGLVKLSEDHGFKVLKIEGVHSVYHTLGWIIFEWLTSKTSLWYWLLSITLFPVLRYQTKHSKTYVDSIASAYRVLGVKTGDIA